MTAPKRPLEHEPPLAPPPKSQSPVQPELPETGEFGVPSPGDIVHLPEEENGEEPV